MPDEKTPDNEPENTNETEIDESALYDAVSGAVDEVTITPENTDDDNENDELSTDIDGETSNDGVSTDGSDDDGSDETDGDKEKSPDGDKTDEETSGDTDADGKTPDGDVSAKEDGTGGAGKKDGDDPEGESDPLNDPIPESTNEKTAERIKSLIGLVKGKNESEEQRDEILERIQTTGTDAEQYANTLNFLSLYNSTDATQRKQALEVARGLVKELALELGEGSTVTKLSDHEDLQAEVEAGTLTESRAIEIAATREAKTLQDSRTAAATAKNDTDSQTQANIQAGTAQLDAVETNIRASDKDYAERRPMFISLLKPVLRRTHPTEWGQAAQEVYDQVKLMPLAKPTPKVVPKNQPLRTKQSAGGGNDKKTETDDALGAMNDALANM